MSRPKHRPVGAYLPVGQLDGDCACGRGAYPCPDTQSAYPAVQGRCPSCGASTVFVAEGGYLTCSLSTCSNPLAPSEALGITFPVVRHG